MTQAVLRRGFAVAALDTLVRHTADCWDVGADGPKIARAVLEVQAHAGLQKAPLYGLGVSSGGMILARLVGGFQLQFSGLVFNVSPHTAELFYGNTAWPRTSFVYAPHDVWAPPTMVLATAKLLQQRGTPVQVLNTEPKPLNELLRYAVQLGIPPPSLALVVDLVRKAGFTKVLPGPTVGSRKETFLAPAGADSAFMYLHTTAVAPILAKLPNHGQGLREEMHALAGTHGVTAEHFEKVLDFVLKQNKTQAAVASLSK